MRDRDRYSATVGGFDRLLAELRTPRRRRPEPGEIVRTALGVPIYLLVNAAIYALYGIGLCAAIVVGFTLLVG
jgi:hypothetical protein